MIITYLKGRIVNSKWNLLCFRCALACASQLTFFALTIIVSVLESFVELLSYSWTLIDAFGTVNFRADVSHSFCSPVVPAHWSCYLKVCDYISEVRGSANASCSHENQCFIFSPICAQSLTWPYLTLPWMYLCIALCVPACIPQCAEICASWRSTTVPFCTVLWSPQHKYCPCCASCERCCCCYSYTVFFIDLVVWNISRCLHKGSSVCIVLPG